MLALRIESECKTTVKDTFIEDLTSVTHDEWPAIHERIMKYQYDHLVAYLEDVIVCDNAHNERVAIINTHTSDAITFEIVGRDDAQTFREMLCLAISGGDCHEHYDAFEKFLTKYINNINLRFIP